jgi:hypothetical protein
VSLQSVEAKAVEAREVKAAADAALHADPGLAELLRAVRRRIVGATP